MSDLKRIREHAHPHTVALFITRWRLGRRRQKLQLAAHETPTYIRLKMEHLIYMFKALSIQAAAKVNIGTAFVFPPNGLAGH